MAGIEFGYPRPAAKGSRSCERCEEPFTTAVEMTTGTGKSKRGRGVFVYACDEHREWAERLAGSPPATR